MLLLITHLIIGYRRLSDIQYYSNDPLVLRTLGLNKLPRIATVSRMLSKQDEKSVDHVRQLSKTIVLDRLALEQLPRITLDFDGTVQSTSRHAEGTAVGAQIPNDICSRISNDLSFHMTCLLSPL